MANNFQITTLNEQGATTVLHPESNADQVLPGTNTKVPLRTEIANWNEKAQEIESARDGKTNLKEKIDDVVTKLTSNIQTVRTDLEKDVSLLDNKTAAEDASLSRKMDGIKNNLQAQVDTWNDFKANGGTISGNVTLTDGGVLEAERVYTKPSNGVKFGTALHEGAFKVMKYDTNGGWLADCLKVWEKDIYSGDYNRNMNGYTKLPNGFILQWGTFDVQGVQAYNWGIKTVTLPTTFNEKALFAVSSVVNTAPSAKAYSQLYNCQKNFLDLKYYVESNCAIVITWVAIGY